MTALVLIPGMMCDARLFGPQLEALADGIDLSVADITQSDCMTELAQHVLTHVPDRFALAGLSMGGIVAMEILRIAPQRVTRLALLDTNPLDETEEVKLKRLPQLQAVREGKLANVMRDEMKPKYLAPGPARQNVLDLCMDMALDHGADVFLRQSKALMDRRDQTETLRQSRIPSLILCGRHDQLCPISRHELMADLMPHAVFEIIDNAGHLPTLETPNATNQALKRWMEAA